MKTSQKIKQNVVNNLAKTTLYENVTELLRMQQIYEAGIKEVRTKLEILDAEFKVKHDHNPIHHIEDFCIRQKCLAARKNFRKNRY